ncbi:MAG: hypothetical protein AAF628_03975 [Planctomycetota bacterium]
MQRAWRRGNDLPEVACGTQPGRRLEATHARHHAVHQDEVVTALRQSVVPADQVLDRRGAIVDDGRAVAAWL